MPKVVIGIYEKALPKDISWEQRFKFAKAAGYQYVEMSLDETDERLARLDWDQETRIQVKKAMLEQQMNIPSMCLSAHRCYPFGSHDPLIVAKAKEVFLKAVQLCIDLGIRNIQLAGYDVYYEEQDQGTRERFKEGMLWLAQQAAEQQIMCSMEIMDTKFMNSITKWIEYRDLVNNPWFQVYPDVGNLSAWGNNVHAELAQGIKNITAIHLKDTYAVTATN